MAVVKLLNLLAISCLAVIASLGPTPIAALSVDNTHHARHGNLHHVGAAKKKRGSSSTKRCKPRATTSAKAKPSSAKPAQAKPTPSSSSPPKPAPSNSGSSSGSSSGGSGAGKAGIAWPNGNTKAIQDLKSWKTEWYYTWSPWCNDYAGQVGLKCCPMLWGFNQVSDFTNLVKPGYANCAMGPNEPDQSGQSNMDVGSAVSLWWKYINFLKDQGYMLVSPACTNSPAGIAWTKSFFEQCQGCQIDRVAGHFYGVDSQAFISYVTQLHGIANRDVWITELACQNFSGTGGQCSADQIWDFASTIITWMDNTPWVDAYFPFGYMQDMANVNPLNRLLSSNNEPNALGKLYLGL